MWKILGKTYRTSVIEGCFLLWKYPSTSNQDSKQCVLHDRGKKANQLCPHCYCKVYSLPDQELATRLGPRFAYYSQDLRRGCELSKSVLLRGNHHQATSSQNLKGLHIINNFIH